MQPECTPAAAPLVAQGLCPLPTSHDSCCRGLSRFLRQFSSVQSLSRVQFFATPWTAACQTSLSSTNSQSLLKLMSIESVMLSCHLILFRPLLLPTFSLSQQQGLFQGVSSSHQVAKVLEFPLQHIKDMQNRPQIRISNTYVTTTQLNK